MEVKFNDIGRTNNLLRNEIDECVKRVLDRGWYILGEEDKKFESKFATYMGARECIGVSNGLDALHLCLAALDLPKDSEVIVPANTFIATALAVSYCGLKLKLVDVEEDSMLIDPDKIREAITDKTRVIMPVHLYGNACDMDKICKIAEEYNIYIIEDNAQAQGCTYKGKKTGTFGIASGTSFYPGKNIGAIGDAGAVITNDTEIAKRVRALANYGSEVRYHHDLRGFNTRLDELQAAVLSVKLDELDNWNLNRKKIAQRYLDEINNKKLILPTIKFDTVWHIFAVRIKENRDRFIGYLKENGIETNIHYPITVNLQKSYELEFSGESYPIAEMLANEVVSIPMFPHMTQEEVTYVIDIINSWEG